MPSLTTLNSLKREEKQWWPGNSVHTAAAFLKSEKGPCRAKKGGHDLWKDATPVKHLK